MQISIRSLFLKHAELFSWLVTIATLVYLLREPLLYGTYVLSHDNYYWSYAIFHYFSTSLAHLTFPLWNPYSHAGEPFYLIPGQIRLFEPLTYVVILFAKILNMDTVQAFAWNRVIGSILMSYGAALCIKTCTKELITKVILPPILLLSTFMLGSFQQDGVYSQFVWAPFIYFFFHRIVVERDNSVRSWLPLAAVMGVNWISYYFAGAWILLCALLTAFFLFERESLAYLFNQKATRKNLLLFFLMMGAMTGPGIAMFAERNHFVFPARMISATLKDQKNGGPMPYEGKPNDVVPSLPMELSLEEATGTFSNPMDYIGTMYLRGSPFIRFAREYWSGNSSEAFFYFGIPVWIIGLLGMVFGKNRRKKIWLFLLFFYVLLTLGPATPLMRLLYYVFPPLWFIRHTHTLILFVQFFFLFFFALGMDCLLTINWRQIFLDVRNEKRKLALTQTAITIAFAMSIFYFLRFVTPLGPLSLAVLSGGIVAIFLTGFLLWLLSKSKIFIVPGIVLGQAAFIYFRVEYSHPFLMEILGFAFLPLLLSALLFSRLKNINQKWLLAPIFVAIPVNLIFTVLWSATLYTVCLSPRLYRGYDTHFPRPLPPLTRTAAPIYLTFGYFQSPRYPELMERQAYAFSNLYLPALALHEIPPAFPFGDTTSANAFELARSSFRWNSFLLPKDYFELVHSPLNSSVLHSMFAVGAPLISFRESLVSLPEASWANL